MNEYINIGKLVATFGVKGELILKHALGKRTTLKGVETIFIEQQKNSYLPYFIQSSKAKDTDEMYVQVEGVESKESAHRLVQKNIWLLDEDFRKIAGKTAPISLLGYILIADKENVGPIEEVIEQPHQVLLRISLNGNEALIPLHEETLQKIDRKKKEVHVVLPDGLLDIYR